MRRKAGDLIEDAMIAATAHVRGMSVVTRNIRHFKLFDVSMLNPFEPTG
jgi:predicted nucleic acid-binding protein